MQTTTSQSICLPSWLALQETTTTQTRKALKRQQANRVMATALVVAVAVAAEVAIADRAKSPTTRTVKTVLNRMSLKTKIRSVSPVMMKHPTTRNPKRRTNRKRKRTVTTKEELIVRDDDDDVDDDARKKNQATPLRWERKAARLARRMPTMKKRTTTTSGQPLTLSSPKKNHWHR